MVPPPRPIPQPSDRFAVAAALLVALLARGVVMGTNAGITMDSPLYVRMAEGLRHGILLGETPAHHGYSLLIALASLVIPGRVLPGRMVALAASLAVVALGFAVARRRVGVLPALGVALVLALHPLLAVYGGVVMTEAPFLALVWLGLWCIGKQRPLAAGLALGAGYWVRPEAAVIVPVAALLMRRPPAARMRLLAGAALALLPYLVLIHHETGHWSLSPKSALVRPVDASARAAEFRVSGGDSLAATSAHTGLLARITQTAPTWGRTYLPTLRRHAQRLLEAWPWPLLALSLLALARRDAWDERLAPLACLFVIALLAAPPDLRFAHLYVVTLALLACDGAMRLWRAPKQTAARAALAVLVCAGAIMLARGPATRTALHFDDGPMTTLMGAGERLAREGRADALVMDRKAYVPFYAHMRHIQLPDDDLDTILRYAQAQHADYIVIEEYVAHSLRPQLLPLLDPDALAREPRVQLLFALRPVAGEGVAVYEIVGTRALSGTRP
jgi:hypothetical protein